MEISVAIPLDPDGFLRRECPSCHRQFKWFPDDDSEPSPDSLYGCPYCRFRSEDFLTPEQADFLTWAAGQEALRELEKQGLKVESEPAPPSPVDLGDMERVDFHCHPREPIKVYEGWKDSQPVFCVICGAED